MNLRSRLDLLFIAFLNNYFPMKSHTGYLLVISVQIYSRASYNFRRHLHFFHPFSPKVDACAGYWLVLLQRTEYVCTVAVRTDVRRYTPLHFYICSCFSSSLVSISSYLRWNVEACAIWETTETWLRWRNNILCCFYRRTEWNCVHFNVSAID